MHGAKNPAGFIRRNRNQAQVERPSKLAYLFKGRANGEVVFRCVVINVFWELWNCSVASVSIEESVTDQ